MPVVAVFFCECLVIAKSHADVSFVAPEALNILCTTSPDVDIRLILMLWILNNLKSPKSMQNINTFVHWARCWCFFQNGVSEIKECNPLKKIRFLGKTHGLFLLFKGPGSHEFSGSQPPRRRIMSPMALWRLQSLTSWDRKKHLWGRPKTNGEKVDSQSFNEKPSKNTEKKWHDSRLQAFCWKTSTLQHI